MSLKSKFCYEDEWKKKDQYKKIKEEDGCQEDKSSSMRFEWSPNPCVLKGASPSIKKCGFEWSPNPCMLKGASPSIRKCGKLDQQARTEGQMQARTGGQIQATEGQMQEQTDAEKEQARQRLNLPAERRRVTLIFHADPKKGQQNERK